VIDGLQPCAVMHFTQHKMLQSVFYESSCVHMDLLTSDLSISLFKFGTAGNGNYEDIEQQG